MYVQGVFSLVPPFFNTEMKKAKHWISETKHFLEYQLWLTKSQFPFLLLKMGRASKKNTLYFKDVFKNQKYYSPLLRHFNELDNSAGSVPSTTKRLNPNEHPEGGHPRKQKGIQSHFQEK